MEFSSKIEDQLASRNIDSSQIKKQLTQLTQGIDAIAINRACIKGDGILTLDDTRLKALIESYNKKSKAIRIVKFVPASGAATRMFKHLFDYSNNKENALIIELFERIQELPFYKKLQQEFTLDEKLKEGNYQEIIDNILYDLNYSKLPKGSISFHDYSDYILTAFEEHLQEGIDYAKGNNEEINIHFTISENFKSNINNLLVDRIKILEKTNTIHLEYSNQQAATDTITTDSDNNIVLDDNNELVFRPGGHGALIHNLNSIDADLIFIKNIDNIVPDTKRKDTIDYKKSLGALALEINELRNEILNALDQGIEIDSVQLDSLFSILEIEKPSNTSNLHHILNRPIRVCGMVKNQGEPGGGPFWVENNKGEISKQIVEKSQINLDDDSQSEILNNATHFNPVDLICITKNYKGEKYDLLQYVDHNTGFISEKSIQGKKINALELPGLWNGAMANWLTVFVEVPLTTFNPVKTVNDLLRPMHQV